MSSDTHLLPTCQKCKVRKVKYDRQAAKCSNCTRGNVACIIVDPITGEQYARDYIRRLEEQEAELKAKVGDERSERGETRDAPTVRSEIPVIDFEAQQERRPKFSTTMPEEIISLLL
jgi:hypothetical protein